MPEFSSSAEYFSAVQTRTGWAFILESFARFVAPETEALILDVGAGPGALVEIFRHQYGANAFGIDCDPAMVYAANQQVVGAVLTGCLPHLPFPDACFDIVTATNVLFLLEAPDAALREIQRVLVPGGSVVLLNPSPRMSLAAATELASVRELTGFARDNLLNWAKIAEANHRWSTSDIETMFAQVGFDPVAFRERIGPGLALYARGAKM